MSIAMAAGSGSVWMGYAVYDWASAMQGVGWWEGAEWHSLVGVAGMEHSAGSGGIA